MGQSLVPWLLIVGGACSGARSTPPNARPSGLAVVPGGPNSLTVSWGENSTNETGFEVERRTGSAAFQPVGTTAGTTAGLALFVDSDLAAATTYAYRVRAINQFGASEFTDAVEARTAETGFVLFSRNNGVGGEDLYFASADGLVQPVRISDNGSFPLDIVDVAARGNNRWAVFVADRRTQLGDVFSVLSAAPLFATGVTGRASDLTGADVIGPIAVFDDRWIVASMSSIGMPRLISADLDTFGGATLAQFPNGTIEWQPPARGDNGAVFFTHRAAPSGGTTLSEVWATQPGSTSLAPVGDHGLQLDSILLDPDGAPMIQGDAIALKECGGSSCAVYDLTIGRPDGSSSRVAGFSAFGIDTSLVAARRLGDRLLFLRHTAIPERRDVLSASFPAGGVVNLTTSVAGTIAWNGAAAGSRVLFTRQLAGPPLAIDLFGVPADGSSPPLAIASNPPSQPVAGEFQSGFVSTGDLVVYQRASAPGNVFTAFASVAASEVQVPVAGFATVLGTVRNAAGAIERVLVAGRTDAGGSSYTDLWSVREQPAGQRQVLRLSQQGQTLQVPDGAGIQLWNTVPKAGCIVYSRGADLFSVDPGVADSEIRISAFGEVVPMAFLDSARLDGVVFCVARGQVWSSDVTGAPPPKQLSDLAAGGMVSALLAVTTGGRIVYRVDRPGDRAIEAADPGLERQPVRVSGTSGVIDTFRFVFP